MTPTASSCPASEKLADLRANALPAAEPRIGSPLAGVLLAREEEGHVDGNAGEDRLLDGGQTLGRANRLGRWQLLPRFETAQRRSPEAIRAAMDLNRWNSTYSLRILALSEFVCAAQPFEKVSSRNIGVHEHDPGDQRRNRSTATRVGMPRWPPGCVAFKAAAADAKRTPSATGTPRTIYAA